MSLRGREITVLGAGIGGVTAALALSARGAQVTVLEQAPALAEVGAGLQIGPNGMQVLQDLGLGDAVLKVATLPEAVELRDHRSGRLVARVPMGPRAHQRYGQPYVQIHRADLLGVLHRAAQNAGVAFRFDAAVSDLVHGSGGVALALKGQGEYRCPVLIAADGVRSLVRRQIVGGTAPEFTGHVAWRGLVDAARVPPELLPDAATVFIGPGRHLVAYPLRQRSLWNIVAVEERAEWTAEGWSSPAEPETVREAFTGWCEPVATLLAALEHTFLWGLFAHPVLERWSEGPVALLGDACHPMLPYLAQGATMAIEDAWVLADALDRSDIPEQAFARYEQQRKPRATRVQRAAARNAGVYHFGSPVLRQGLHLGLRTVSTLAPMRLLASYDWLYGFDVTQASSSTQIGT